MSKKVKNMVPYLAGISFLVVGIYLGKKIQIKKQNQLSKKEKEEEIEEQERHYIKLR